LFTNIHRAQFPLHTRHGRLDLRTVGDIGFDRHGGNACLLQIRQRFLVLLRIAAQNRHRRSSLSESQRDAAPQAAIAASDQRHTPAQIK
jgi:hypothetical protein